MKEPLNILFYENGDPLEYRCIERSLQAFPRGYWTVVRKVINRTYDGLDEKIFKINVARLLPSFKMTRAGPFQGIWLDKTETLRDDDYQAVGKCWKSVEDELCPLKKYLDSQVRDKRSRILVELPEAGKHVIKTASNLFKTLSEITVKNKRGGQSEVGSVAASKILFAVLPEIALPVDTSEWDDVFCTEDYGEVLTAMLTEIKKWERVSEKKLDERDRDSTTTLPAIYNVLAMAARPIQETNQRNRKQEGNDSE